MSDSSVTLLPIPFEVKEEKIKIISVETGFQLSRHMRKLFCIPPSPLVESVGGEEIPESCRNNFRRLQPTVISKLSPYE